MNNGEWSKQAIEQARESFPHFLYIVWDSIGLPEPTRVQLDMALYLQESHDHRRILQAFRGIGKSFITCAYVVWRLWRDPNTRVLIVSASGDRADANARFIKKIINIISFLHDLQPSKEQLDTQNIFEVGGALPDASPSVKSVGITGQITGTRGDIIIADDVEIPKNSATQMQRDKLSEAVKEFDAILKPNGEVLYLGTPQCEASLYVELENRGYNTRIWPVQVPTVAEYSSYNGRLAPMISKMFNEEAYGEPTDPKRFNAGEIADRLLSYGKAGFALQFMLNTNLSDFEKYPLKCSDLIVTALDKMESSLKWSWTANPLSMTQLPCTGLKGDAFYRELSRTPETMPYTGTVMAVDPSGRGRDETTYAIIKFLCGYLYVMEVDGMFDGYSDLSLTQLAQRAKYWGVNEIVVESNFGDGMFTKLMNPVFKKIHPCTITEVRHSTQKEVRIIDTLEPVLMQHKLIMNESVIENDYRRYQVDPKYSLIYQLTRICRDKNALAHDDRLDALAMAVAYWCSQMDVEHEEEASQMTTEWLEDAMDVGLLNMSNKIGTMVDRGNKACKNIMDLRSR